MKKSGRKRIAAKKAAQQKRKMLILGGSILAVVVIIFFVSFLALRSKVNSVPKNIICNNIFIDNVDVSGMNAKEAKAALEKHVEEYYQIEITLVAEDEKLKAGLDKFGFYMKNLDKQVKAAVSYGKSGSVWKRYSQIKELEKTRKDLAAVFAIDAETTEKLIEEQFPELENAAKNATITRQNGQFVITNDKKGVMIDLDESIKIIEAYFDGNWSKDDGSIDLVTKVDEPKIAREDLEKVKDLLGTFTTTFVAGSDRGQNLRTGASRINGTLLMPGDEFSANDAMKPYTLENGYKEAGAYENGKVVQSMGGGICQVSSTLYNAVILSELEIVERAAHSMLVAYVKPSMDAAIAGDYKDLKFKNSTDYPIYIEGYTSGGNITFNVYGKETRASSRKVAYETEIISQDAVAKKFVATSDAIGPMKKASSGYAATKAKLWKVVYENGVEVSRKVQNNSTYRGSAAVYNVGVSSDNAEAAAIVRNAIASQNEATINAAITQAQQLIAASQAPVTPTTPTTPTTPETTTPEETTP